MDTPSLPGSYPAECTDPYPVDPVADHRRRRFSSSSSIELLSLADRLHLEVYFESRTNSGYAAQLAGFLLGIAGFIFSTSAVVLKTMNLAASESVDSAQITEYFKARSAERSPPPPPLRPPEPSPLPSPESSSTSLDSISTSIPPESTHHPLVTRHVTFHVEAGDPEAQSLASSSTSFVATVDPSSKPNTFLSHFAKRRPSVNRGASESQVVDPGVSETTSPLKPRRRLFNRSATDAIVPTTVASASSVPYEDEEPSPADISMSPSPSRPPHVLRRSMKGIKEVIRRRPRAISISPLHSPVATDDDDGQGISMPSPTEVDPVNSPHPPTSHSALQPNDDLYRADSTSKRPFLSRAPSTKRRICPNMKSSTVKPPPLRTAYTYTFMSVETPVETPKNEEEVITDPPHGVSSPSIRRPSYPRGRTTYDGRRFASDPIPVFTPLTPSAISPSSAVAAARTQAYCALEGLPPSRDRRMSTPPKTSAELSAEMRAERSSRSSLPPPERLHDPIVLLGLHRRSSSDKRHSTQ